MAEEHTKIAYQHGHLANCNIFKPLAKTDKREGGIEIKAKVGKTELRVRLWQQLDTADEDLLLSLLALARPIHHTEAIDHESKEVAQKYLWTELEVEHMPEAASIAVNTTRHELIAYMHKQKGKAAYAALLDSLRRLQGANIEFKSSRGRGAFNLLSWFEKPDGSLKIAIDPWTASLLLGEKNVSYARIDLSERFDLPKGICRRLHTLLNCSSTRNGTGKMSAYKLATKIWNKDINSIDAKLLAKLKALLSKLDGLPDWSIRYKGRGNKCIVYWRKPLIKKNLLLS